MKRAVFFLVSLLALPMAAQQRLDLSGKWSFTLDEQRLVRPGSFLSDSVQLPGTTDTNRRGHVLQLKSETTHLSRLFSYKGRAWYKRTVIIPDSWQGQPVTLFLERTKPSEVYVDGRYCGKSNDISTPQVYDLTTQLTPGRHELAIMVDNSSGVPEQLYASSHAYTEDTQTNWNGIIGRIELINGIVPQTPQDSQPSTTITVHDHHFYDAAGHRLFLRGRHDACVWPLTGHVPMDLASWQAYMKTCQDYGLNHVRFHSWCPPEAAFQAADEAGIILQPELPFWGDFNAADSVLMQFLHKEGENILRWYGHHPSFRMFALGNELWGSIDKMADFVTDFRRIAPDKLYTFGSNYYLGYQGVKPGMDYFTTCRVGGEAWGTYDTHTRGSFSFADAFDGGVINHFHPNTTMNFAEACKRSPVPVISHETGQFQIYPDFREISKYTGVLYPYNMEVFRQRLERNNMLQQNYDFHRASGRWAALLYKQDIEMDLRTPNMAGFQLLDLQDYPGQGSAYVGMLDAFMDSKHIIKPEEWRGFCSDKVALFVADKLCFTNGEGIYGKVQVANYSGRSLQGDTLRWRLQRCEKVYGSGFVSWKTVKMGHWLIDSSDEGLIDVGSLRVPIGVSDRAWRYRLQLALSHNTPPNYYDLWSYPEDSHLDSLKRGIVITHQMSDEIGEKLMDGASVLLMPDSTEFAGNTIGPLFQTDYWNYRMFKTICENNKKAVSPGTLGIFCEPQHPLFRCFPTEEHTNWQWFPVLKHSRPLIMDRWEVCKPLIQVIDNVERNHKLALALEYSIGKGRLLIVMSDLEQASAYVEGRQFYRSVLEYMHSDDFHPDLHIIYRALRELLREPYNDEKLQELNNISPY